MKQKKTVEVIRDYETEGEIVPPIVYFPKALNDIEMIAKKITARAAIIVNLQKMGVEEKLRAIDFLSGVSFAMNTERKMIENSIFLFRPTININS